MVKCSECGFLAALTAPGVDRVPYLAEMLEQHRSEGIIGWPIDTYMGKPLCFMRVAWFGEQMEGVLNYAHPDLRPVIHVEQSCDQFTRWHQGLSPKEHYEMNMMEEQRLWQAEQVEADRLWRVQQEDRQRKWQKEDTDFLRTWQAEQGNRLFRWNGVIFGIAVTLILVGGSVLAAFIERGSLFGPSPAYRSDNPTGTTGLTNYQRSHA